jgi:hypothetical protein
MATIAFNIGAEDSGKFSFKTFLRHKVIPFFFKALKQKKKLGCKLNQKNEI